MLYEVITRNFETANKTICQTPANLVPPRWQWSTRERHVLILSAVNLGQYYKQRRCDDRRWQQAQRRGSWRQDADRWIRREQCVITSYSIHYTKLYECDFDHFNTIQRATSHFCISPDPGSSSPGRNTQEYFDQPADWKLLFPNSCTERSIFLASGS